MPADDLRNARLVLVQGGGERRRTRRTQLELLKPPKPHPPQQLALPGAQHAPATVLSLGLTAVDFWMFATLLPANGVRRVIDMRASPSFRGKGFSAVGVSALLRNLSIVYDPVPSLANRFIGTSSNERVVLAKFAEYLEGCTEMLREVRAKIDNGPVLLLGWSAQHDPSERSVLTDALTRIQTGFSLVVLP